MTHYCMTYTEQPGAQPFTMTLALGNDEQGRQFASRTAQRVHAVSLFAMDDEGLPTPMAEWLNGILTSRDNVRPVTIEGETVENDTEQEIDTGENGGEAIITISDAEDTHRFEGYCMKCNEKREFAGLVKERSNGSKQAIGNCPVCGTKISRMVSKSTPADEWDEPEQQPETDETQTEVSDTSEEIAEAISEVVEGQPIAEVAEATEQLAAEFSHAAAEAEEKPKRKRAPRKASADKRTPNQKAAANPTKVHCPECDQDVDAIERAGLLIYTAHEKPNGNRCGLSTTVVGS